MMGLCIFVENASKILIKFVKINDLVGNKLSRTVSAHAYKTNRGGIFY